MATKSITTPRILVVTQERLGPMMHSMESDVDLFELAWTRLLHRLSGAELVKLLVDKRDQLEQGE